MKEPTPLRIGGALLALVLSAAGCAPAESPATGDAPAAASADAGFRYQGDFRGPLGLQLYSVRKELERDVPGTLRRVHDLGFREVELAGTYGLTAEQFRAELDRAGLRATSMHVDYGRLRDSLQAVLREAKTLGVEYVGTAWVPHEPLGAFTEQTVRRTAADFNRWGAAAREQGLQFFYHIHGYEFQPTATGETPFDLLVRETDPEDVKFQMDVMWAAAGLQDPAALLRKYPDRWALTHLKDKRGTGSPYNPATRGQPPMVETTLGSGDIDYREVLRAAEEIGIERHYLEDERETPFSSLPQSIGWLERVEY